MRVLQFCTNFSFSFLLAPNSKNYSLCRLSVFFVFSKRSEEFISLLTLRIVQKLFLHWLISKRRFGLICQTNIDMCVFRWIQEMWGDGIANFLLITELFSRREMLSKTLAAVRQSRVLHPGGVKTFLPILLVFTDSTTMIWHEEWRWHHWSLFY